EGESRRRGARRQPITIDDGLKFGRGQIGIFERGKYNLRNALEVNVEGGRRGLRSARNVNNRYVTQTVRLEQGDRCVDQLLARPLALSTELAPMSFSDTRRLADDLLLRQISVPRPKSCCHLSSRVAAWQKVDVSSKTARVDQGQ